MVLYLDIDGVMVPANSWRRPEILEDGFPAFSLKAVNALNCIILSASADIILTTSHKHIYSLNEWWDIFKRRKVIINKISRLPKNTNHLTRKDELINWFKTETKNTQFVIIDDDKSLNALPKYLKDKLIQTSSGIGLTDELANQAIEILDNSKHQIAK